jgi:hypothetical protein
MSDAYPNYMQMHGSTLVTNGYSILPIQSGTKAPGRYTGGAWSNYPAWSRHCDRATTDFEVEIWATWPGCAIGLACGHVVGIDIDITDDTVAWQVEELARLYLGDTPCKRIGLPPKRMLVYRAAGPFPSRKTKPLEILSHGTQFVIHAIHPDTKSPYQWPNSSLVETDIADLPEVDAEMIDTFYAEAWKIIPADMKRGGHNPDAIPASYVGAEGASLHGKRGTVPAISAALEYVPNDGLDRADWIGVGMSIKGALGDDGFPLWIEWSRSSDKSGKSGKTDTPEKTWRSLKPHSRGAGSLYYRAMANGWRPAPGLVLNGDLAALPQVDVSGLMEKFRKIAPPAVCQADDPSTAEEEAARIVTGIPLDLMEVEGALKMFMDECQRTARRHQPFLALAAALCAVGTLAGRRYRSETNLRTNLYAIAIAESGSGKDNAPNVVRETLIRAGLTHYLGGEDLASGRGIIAAIAKHPCRLFQIDEFGLFLKEVTSAKSAPHQKAIKSELMKLYSRAQSIYLGAEYADQRDRDRIDIHQPHACLYGTSTALTFREALTAGAMVDGFMARLLVFWTDNNRPPRNPSQAIIDPPQCLLEACQDIATGIGGVARTGGNLTGADGLPFMPKMDSKDPPSDIYTVTMSSDARVEHAAWLEREDALAISLEGTNKASIANRWAENATRLAMIRAISRHPHAPQITATDVSWGWRLAEHCIQTTLRDTDQFLSETQYEAELKKTLYVIKEAGLITASALGRKLQTITARNRQDILADLRDQELIEEVVTAPRHKPGPPTRAYRATNLAAASGD